MSSLINYYKGINMDANTEIYPAEIETLIDAMKSIGGVS